MTLLNADFNFVGCAHAQQLIWQLLNAVEKGIEAAGDTDQAFLNGELLTFIALLKIELSLRCEE